jgi:perosamine synthetase
MSNIEVTSMSFEPGAVSSSDVIPLCVPEIRGNEWKYVKECLDTNWVSSAGPFVDRFERSVADYVGVAHAVAAVNGTAALQIALLVAGVAPDEEVLLPAITFIAPANAVRYVGAWPVFIDVDENHWQLDPLRVGEFFDQQCTWKNKRLINSTTGRRISALLPVHILGHPCDMDALLSIAEKFELKVIEDATESLGARYKNRMVGSDGHIACFSFNGNKIITTGGGGMIVTENAEWAQRARYLTTQAKDNPIEYIHNEIGYNYRLSNLQAAVGCAQIEQLDEFVSKKRSIAARYDRALSDVPGIEFMREAEWASSAHWLYTLLIDEHEFGMDSRCLLDELGRNKIQARPLWQPLHRSRAHANSPAAKIKIADRIHRQALSIPSSVGLNESDQTRVIETIRQLQEINESAQ